MNYLLHFYHRGSLVGSVEHPSLYIKGTAAAPFSRHFFCPKCGDIWGKIEVSPQSRWTFEPRKCEKCGGKEHLYSHFNYEIFPPEVIAEVLKTFKEGEPIYEYGL